MRSEKVKLLCTRDTLTQRNNLNKCRVSHQGFLEGHFIKLHDLLLKRKGFTKVFTLNVKLVRSCVAGMTL